MFDIIIIGMGISGITAGIYAKRADKKVLILEKSMPGGVLANISKISNYPGYTNISGSDLAMNLLNQVNALEIPYKFEEVLSVEDGDIKKIITNKNTYETKKIIIATGRKPKFTDTLSEYLGKGLSICATCDGALYKGEDVIVIGNVVQAISEALYLSSIVNKVYFITKLKNLNELENKDNIEIIYDTSILKINKKDNNIDSVELSNGKNIHVKGIFSYAGYIPNTDIFKNLNILDNEGNILVNSDYETNIKGIYSIGDCIKKDIYQLVSATYDGCKAIISIINKKE